ncbi:MAG: polyprenyl synthetase family protein [Flavobacteriales bacterium]|nr:polyprenyl synthetase family protein [Flavobacteriales bacterium]
MERHRALIDAHVGRWKSSLPENGLYAPMAYLLDLPAKRVRPVLVMMGCELFGGKAEDVLDEALGIELFHNFTLMHDDIMDEAPLRRGRATVHAKWNTNTAILSGDAMLVKAYQLMGKRADVLELFSRYALQVCEGQQFDMDYEQRRDVHIDEYVEMIRLKTAVLLSCALQVGAACAGAPREQQVHIGSYGEHLGLAFQLRDDLLDAFGDPGKVGKQVGGDLRAGKKTYLLIRGLELSAAAGRNELREELAKAPADRDVQRMLTVLEELGVRAETEAEVHKHDAQAMAALAALNVPLERKAALTQLAATLLQRTS